MSKRRLSDQQGRRIKAHQRKVLKSSSDENQICLPATLVANLGQFLEVLAEDGQIYRCLSRQNLGILVPGDCIMFALPLPAEEYGVIKAVHQRRTELARPDRYKQKKCMAANIDIMMIVVAHEPKCVPYFIDQYLVAAELSGFQPFLVLNKVDCLNVHELLFLNQILEIYKKLDIPVLQVSAQEKIGIDAVLLALAGQKAIVVGQSGVGKSSLVNALLGHEGAVVGSMSEANQKGRHTTTTAKLYQLPQHAMLIDSPGIREFGLWHLDEEEIVRGFKEFSPYLRACRFRNCDHRHADGCALVQAVEKGLISPQRLESYYRLLDAEQ